MDEYAQRLGIKSLHGGTVKRNKEDAYTYITCFKNVIVGGHFMEKFYVNIMINGADDIFVIGNDFLNACNYQHRAGENKFVVENPNVQKYNENLERLHTLSSEHLSMLLFNLESDKKTAASDENLIVKELVCKGNALSIEAVQKKMVDILSLEERIELEWERADRVAKEIEKKGCSDTWWK